ARPRLPRARAGVAGAARGHPRRRPGRGGPKRGAAAVLGLALAARLHRILGRGVVRGWGAHDDGQDAERRRGAGDRLTMAVPRRPGRASQGCNGNWDNPAVKHQLPVPHPYDFDRSMFRFRLFGDDLASRWQRGALHRVLASGLPVRIAADGVTAYGSYTEADE